LTRCWRIFDAQGNQIASNDDNLETHDSTLFDVILPADGLYYVEVDSFSPDPSRDLDVGQYELFAYSFAYSGNPQAALSSGDTLVAGNANDTLVSSSGNNVFVRTTAVGSYDGAPVTTTVQVVNGVSGAVQNSVTPSLTYYAVNSNNTLTPLGATAPTEAGTYVVVATAAIGSSSTTTHVTLHHRRRPCRP